VLFSVAFFPFYFIQFCSFFLLYSKICFQENKKTKIFHPFLLFFPFSFFSPFVAQTLTRPKDKRKKENKNQQEIRKKNEVGKKNGWTKEQKVEKVKIEGETSKFESCGPPTR